MKIYLAPMEGVVDSIMRALLTQIGGFDACVTEFLRVTGICHSKQTFLRHCPELADHCLTPAGTPVIYQFLGGDPELLALNARHAVELGATGIDLNFGCPAKRVNNHDGGAVLLKQPHRVHDIVSQVRKMVPKEIPVSAKIRLGFEDKSLALENSLAAEEGGASFLTVHARTKKEGYRPPAHWEWIARIKEVVQFPVIANGDIWTVEDYLRCRDITGCEDVMLGRGALATPDLALQIKAHVADTPYIPAQWHETVDWLLELFDSCLLTQENPRFAICRLKQWSRMISRGYEQASLLFDIVKKLEEPKDIRAALLHQKHSTSPHTQHLSTSLSP